MFIYSTEQWQVNLLKIVLSHYLMILGKKHFPGRHPYLQRSFLYIVLSPHNSVSVLYLDCIPEYKSNSTKLLSQIFDFLLWAETVIQQFKLEKQINTADCLFWFSAWTAQMTTFILAQGRERKCRKRNEQLREDGLITDTKYLSCYDLN